MLELRMNGPVVDDADAWFYTWFGEPCISPSSVLKFLDDAGSQDVTFTINSYGGSVFAGSDIYTAIKNHPGNVEVIISGIAASIASVIAMAGDTIKISPLGQIMIHNAAMMNYGDHEDMAKASEILFGTSESLATVYASKTGKTVDEMMSLMTEESWYTAEKAVEIGFADEVLFAEKKELSMVASAGGIVDKSKIAEFKALLANKAANPLEKEEKVEAIDSPEALATLVSKIVDEKLSEKTKKSKQKPVKATGLSKFIH